MNEPLEHGQDTTAHERLRTACVALCDVLDDHPAVALSARVRLALARMAMECRPRSPAWWNTDDSMAPPESLVDPGLPRLCWFRHCEDAHPMASRQSEVTCPLCRAKLRAATASRLEPSAVLKLTIERAFADTVLSEDEYRWCLAQAHGDREEAARYQSRINVESLMERAPNIIVGIEERKA